MTRIDYNLIKLLNRCSLTRTLSIPFLTRWSHRIRPWWWLKVLRYSLNLWTSKFSFYRSIISNPFESKFRHIKISNNTIKTKLMVLTRINELLTQLGYIRENEDTYTLKDEQIGDFLEGSPAIDYKLRLLEARQRSQADYEK